MVHQGSSAQPLGDTHDRRDRGPDDANPVASNHNMSMPEMVPLDPHGRVLLSPPPKHERSDPFEVVQSESPERMRVSLDEKTTRNNLAAYSNNSQTQWTYSGQEMNTVPPGDLLHGLHIRTDVSVPRRSGSSHSVDSEGRLRQSMSWSSIPRRIPSIRAALHSSAGSLSPGSVLTSPQIAAILDMTPLPSPTLAANDPWRLVRDSVSRRSSTASRSDVMALVSASSNLSPASPSRRKGYPSLRPGSESSNVSDARTSAGEAYGDTRNRSVSDYVPEAVTIPKPRNIAVSSTGPLMELTQSQANMHREEYLGEARGLKTPTTAKVPFQSNLDESVEFAQPPAKRAKREIYHANSISSGQPRDYASIQLLGQGTFSKVFLATRHVNDQDDHIDYTGASTTLATLKLRSKRLVAVKVVEHGPAGGADAERIEVSLQREVEILKAVRHPSVVHLRAYGSSEAAQALLVMNYCPGGDLFEVASTKLDIMTPSLVRRIFAELVSAVRYLHSRYIVHRDLKLENILLNIPIHVHPSVPNWQTLDQAVVTVTDLGLSRHIPGPPQSPLLTTRCGSEDYAAPELLMGQPYDGRQTDAWALGVLLYSLLEGRLPFDPLPGARGDPAVLRARTPHRIARMEWAWYRYGDDDGEWDPTKGAPLDGARMCVEALLERQSRRKPLDQIQQMDWVKNGITVDGGLRLEDEDDEEMG